MVLRLAALIVAALTLGAGCDERDGRPRAADHARDDEIQDTIDRLWKATGVDMTQISIGKYAFFFEPDNRGCAGLDREDSWFGERGTTLPSNVIDGAALESAIIGFLDQESFAIERYRSTHPADTGRAIRAIKGELVVFGHLDTDGSSDINVRSGPCAPAFTTLDPKLYELDD